MSYLICSIALVVLIIAMPYFYSLEVKEITTKATRAELLEIADYTSNTLANLYYLANSTTAIDMNLTKELIYLPLTVQDSFYNLAISSTGDNASKITATLRDNPNIASESWLVPGLKIERDTSVEVSGKLVVVGCYWNGASYEWMTSFSNTSCLVRLNNYYLILLAGGRAKQ